MAADVVSNVRRCDSCARPRVRPLARRSPLTVFPATMRFQDLWTSMGPSLGRPPATGSFW